MLIIFVYGRVNLCHQPKMVTIWNAKNAAATSMQCFVSGWSVSSNVRADWSWFLENLIGYQDHGHGV